MIMTADNIRVLANLRIIVEINRADLDLNNMTRPLTQHIERWGIAIHYAKKYLSGERHITADGCLRSGHVEGFPVYDCMLHITDALENMVNLERYMKGGHTGARNPLVHCHCRATSGSMILYLAVDQAGLYSPEIRRDRIFDSIATLPSTSSICIW